MGHSQLCHYGKYNFLRSLLGKEKKQIKSMREGLKTLQLYDQIKEHAKFFKIYFICPKHQLDSFDLIILT